MIHLYKPCGIRKVPGYDLLSTLEEYEYFEVFISFTDPRSGDSFADRVRFYPIELLTTKGRGFLAEQGGIPIYLPSDPDFWDQDKRTTFRDLTREVTVLERGEYVTKPITFEVGKIRVPDPKVSG